MSRAPRQKNNSLSRWFLFTTCAFVLAACGGGGGGKSANGDSASAPLAINEAQWNARGLELSVSGTIASQNSTQASVATTATTASVVVSDADRQETLDTLTVATDQTAFSTVIENLTSVPCSIAVQVGGQRVQVPVAGAPVNCRQLVSAAALTLNVRRARWDALRTSLVVIGVAPVPNTLKLSIGGTTDLLANIAVNDRLGRTQGSWVYHVMGLDSAKVPCSIEISDGVEKILVAVARAPTACIGTPAPAPVPAPNTAPVGTISSPATNVSIAAGSTVTFSGTGADANNNVPLTYAWDFGGGATNSTQQNPGAVTFAIAGTYTVKFTVKDSLGLADANPPTRTITVTAGPGAPQPNQAPTGTLSSPASNITITAGATVSFAGSGMDPDNNLPLSYAWDFGGGATNSTQQNPGAVTFATAGTYTVQFTVKDSLGLADANPPMRTITVTAGPIAPQPNQAPTGTISSPATNMSIAAGATVSFAGTGMDPDNNLPLSYAWDFGGGATNSTQQNPGAMTFATAGTYTVKFTVTDSLGLAEANPPTRTITVTPATAANQAPTGTISSPAANVSIAPGATVSFAGSGTDPDNNLPLTYAWDFGGGATNSTQQNPGAVTFATAGTYTVKFTVTDSLGLADENPPTRTITVAAAGSPPLPGGAPSGSITSPAADMTVKAGDTVDFNGMGTDPANLTLTYAWNFAGGAPNSTLQMPGKVVFATPGIYPVSLTVSNSAGTVDATPDTRMITVTAAAAATVVLGADKEGMTFPENDYSVFSMLPLGNSLRAQVVQGNLDPKAMPKTLANTAVKVDYMAMKDAKNSITTTSATKVNFWPAVNTQYSFALSTGVTLQPDQGLQGTKNKISQSMPGTANIGQAFGIFDNTVAGANIFEARFIPMVPKDDANAVNNYPLLRVAAADSVTSAPLGYNDMTVSVANQMDCATGCHVTGGNAADAAETARLAALGATVTWSTNPDLLKQSRENISIVHEAYHPSSTAGLTDFSCASCHYTKMADVDGVGKVTTQSARAFSLVVHRGHGFAPGKILGTATTPAVIADDKCGSCHESGGVKYSRGAMATANQTCADCHGGMFAVGGRSNLLGKTPTGRREPYKDQPRCESCHIGDLLTVATGPTVLKKAYEATDLTAAPRLVPTSRYAQEVGKSYADSLGHGKISCIGCHGSSHAEWPVTDATSNDNVAPMHLQGHRGVLTECKACHVGGVDVSLQTGPHGLHAINDPGWVAQHAVVYTANPKACTACHGLTLDGDYLARAATDRSFIAKDGTTVTYKKGDKVACVECHAKPTL